MTGWEFYDKGKFQKILLLSGGSYLILFPIKYVMAKIEIRSITDIPTELMVNASARATSLAVTTATMPSW